MSYSRLSARAWLTVYVALAFRSIDAFIHVPPVLPTAVPQRSSCAPDLLPVTLLHQAMQLPRKVAEGEEAAAPALYPLVMVAEAGHTSYQSAVGICRALDNNFDMSYNNARDTCEGEMATGVRTQRGLRLQHDMGYVFSGCLFCFTHESPTTPCSRLAAHTVCDASFRLATHFTVQVRACC